jgi:hypothetical protein
MRFDIHSDMDVKNVFGPVAMNADNTPSAIDLQGYHAAELVLGVGIGGITFDATNKIEFVLTHSDDDSSYSNVTDDDVLGVTGITGGIIKSLVAAHAAAAKYRVGYRGGKRYLKLLANFSGTHGSATPLSAEVVAMRPEVAPVANAA